MINELREKIAYYVSKNANINDWENVRTLFGEYSYLMFLFICSKTLDNVSNLLRMQEIVANYYLEDSRIVDEIVKLPDADRFVDDINVILSVDEIVDVPQLYQEYIAIDFILKGRKIVFEKGKNGRDVLGSYYTQEKFAELITMKAVEDYCNYNYDLCVKKLRIADYSCGGAAFLKAAIKICNEKKFDVEIFGYDVDPIAIIISRFLLIKEYPRMKNHIHLVLGNPLLKEESGIVDRFKIAIQGRFYSRHMGVDTESGMDIVLGNPPWEKIRFEEKKFLHHYVPDAEVGTKAEREKTLSQILSNNVRYYNSLNCDYEVSKEQIRKSDVFNYSNCGELNTYALFTELSGKKITERGIVSLIVKSSLVKMPVYSSFFKMLVETGSLYELFMFINREKIFNIDSREEFAILYMTNCLNQKLQVALNLRAYEDFYKQPTIQLSAEELKKINPETGMIPSIKNVSELQFLLNMSNAHKTFGEVFQQCRFGRLVHLTNHSRIIAKEEKHGFVPIYEGKFIEHYTAKFATFGKMTEMEKYKNKATARTIENPQGTEYPEARFYIEERGWENISKNFNNSYIIAWRSLTSSTNRRTMLATALPLIPTCQSIQILQMDELKQMLHVLALFNSIVFDYMVRLKMAGLDLTQTIIRQIPVPATEIFENELEFKDKKATISVHLLSRIKKLYEDDMRLHEMFDEIETYEVCDNRKTMIADIDKLIAKTYGLTDDNLKKIAKSFDSFYTEEEVENLF